jgi:eukaryotic-like serine/threonine-protein kinase
MTPSRMDRARIGDYRLEVELERSTSAVSYRATHQVLPRQVIVKVAREASDSLAVLREACILAALPHPGIVRVYETGRLADHRTWFAAEIVDGLSLAGTLELGALDAEIAVGIARDVAEILAYAHQRGVVHGGISPDRLVVTARTRGFPMCITDWSAARTHDAQSAIVVEPSPYTAPELARHELDDRADVYALGAITYRALAGVLPDGTALGVRQPKLPIELASLVDQMLAYDRWDRPSSAEVRTALAGTAQPEPMRLRRPRWTPPLHFAPGEGEELLSSAPTIDDLEAPKS